MSTSVMEVILLNQESFQKENASGDESKTPGDGLVERELKTLQHTWGNIQKLAQNRQEQSMKSENSIFTIKKSRSGLISVVSYV